MRATRRHLRRATLILCSLVVASAIPVTQVAGADVVPEPVVFEAGAANTKATGGPPTGTFGSGAAPVEVDALRTQTSRTFATPDGSMETELSQASLHYADASGAWQPIDNTLVASEDPGYAVRNRANRLQVRLPADVGSAPVRVGEGPRWVS
ncbi:MAG TPA: hypothetical protein VK988_19945, partial [Acidimicrobiales bacterium]|nr:hypothetical protein [Acidimicrobiales bacterium]